MILREEWAKRKGEIKRKKIINGDGRRLPKAKIKKKLVRKPSRMRDIRILLIPS
jgi:hypothetical protein